ncbi:hypothetical protein EV359DRAFT_63354 [Lentinula novae-zelandiae]|nr:hypothetical protein EV359DRAFT_63354 [Lentinula novae-zelandiae]
MSTLDQIQSENGQWASADHEWNTFTNLSTGNNQQLTTVSSHPPYAVEDVLSFTNLDPKILVTKSYEDLDTSSDPPLKKKGVNHGTTWDRQSTFVGPALLSRRDMPNRDIFSRYGRRRCCLAIFEWNITPMLCDLSLVNIFASSLQRARSANFKKSHEPFAWGIPTRTMEELMEGSRDVESVAFAKKKNLPWRIGDDDEELAASVIIHPENRRLVDWMWIAVQEVGWVPREVYTNILRIAILDTKPRI